MKLALVAPLVSAIREPQRGGSQAFVSDLARGLVDRGHDVHLYAASGSQVRGVQVIDTGVDHRALQATLYRASDGAAARESGAGRVGPPDEGLRPRPCRAAGEACAAPARALRSRA